MGPKKVFDKEKREKVRNSPKKMRTHTTVENTLLFLL